MSEELEGSEIELLDLGDAMLETKQWLLWPIWYDSAFLLGEKDP
jgi:hypothetical protein